MGYLITTIPPRSRLTTWIFFPGHSIPVSGDWPNTLRQFIVQACHLQPTSGEEAHISREHQAEGDLDETKQTNIDRSHSPFRNIYDKLTKPFGTR